MVARVKSGRISGSNVKGRGGKASKHPWKHSYQVRAEPMKYSAETLWAVQQTQDFEPEEIAGEMLRAEEAQS